MQNFVYRSARDKNLLSCWARGIFLAELAKPTNTTQSIQTVVARPSRPSSYAHPVHRQWMLCKIRTCVLYNLPSLKKAVSVAISRMRNVSSIMAANVGSHSVTYSTLLCPCITSKLMETMSNQEACCSSLDYLWPLVAHSVVTNQSINQSINQTSFLIIQWSLRWKQQYC